MSVPEARPHDESHAPEEAEYEILARAPGIMSLRACGGTDGAPAEVASALHKDAATAAHDAGVEIDRLEREGDERLRVERAGLADLDAEARRGLRERREADKRREELRRREAANEDALERLRAEHVSVRAALYDQRRRDTFARRTTCGTAASPTPPPPVPARSR
ncbi:MAG: hypothetical protein H0T20_06430 [Actinobacteria bacterium]|nr:hypothetical protein [Actinomycetota bacterium]